MDINFRDRRYVDVPTETLIVPGKRAVTKEWSVDSIIAARDLQGLPRFNPDVSWALSESGGATTGGAAAAPMFNIWNANASRHIWIREIGFFIASTAVAADIELARQATRGTQTASLTPVQQDPADVAPTWVIDNTWSAAPTAPATMLRRIQFGANIGAGVIWTWPPSGNSKGLKVAAGAGLLMWTLTASTVLRYYAVADE